MKIIEQYLHEIGRRLPAKGRTETVKELRSLLLDEIEERYGPEATEENAKEVIAEFGPPSEVAKRYSGSVAVIAPALADLYYLILGIVLGAMVIASTTVFIVELATGAIGASELGGAVAGTLGSIVSGFLSGAGVLTLIFIGITRLGWNEGLDTSKDWTPEELRGVIVEPESESKVSHIAAIAGGVVAIVLLNLFPGIVSLAEQAIELTGAELGHYLNISLFSSYVIVYSIIAGLEIVHRVGALRLGENKPALRLARIGITLATIALSGVMLGDMRLYLGYENIIGFRLIVMIALVGNIIELITELVAYGKLMAARSTAAA
ncbi:MAG: HAAS signaling domain-containing protein [Spirochaetota bacterium]